MRCVVSLPVCLITFSYRSHPDYLLVLAANRDEFYDRPTDTARWWTDAPSILGGRDLKAMGTWMAVNKSGDFAAVTNYRDMQNIKENARSRGDLPVRFLKGKRNAKVYASSVFRQKASYNGFNLLAMDANQMVHVSNYDEQVNFIEAGVHGLSNALLDTPWPKVEKAKTALASVLSEPFGLQDLLDIMQNAQQAPDADLPDTGVGIEMERQLSPVCIRMPHYGTCCSTALTIDYEGNVSFLERSYPVGNRTYRDVSFRFKTDVRKKSNEI